jgi:hypothetical protein
MLLLLSQLERLLSSLVVLPWLTRLLLWSTLELLLSIRKLL